MSEVSREDFAIELIGSLHAPYSLRNRWALVSWMQAEGGPKYPQAKFNPLNTTKAWPGSTIFNHVGVRNYPTLEAGVEATRDTLLEPGHGYEKIVKRLRRNAWAINTLRAVLASDWGTGGLAMLVLPYTKAGHLDDYGAVPIGQ